MGKEIWEGGWEKRRDDGEGVNGYVLREILEGGKQYETSQENVLGRKEHC